MTPRGAFLYRPGMDSVRTLFFARYRDLLGLGEIDIPLAAPLSLEQFVGALRARGEPFDRLPRDPAVAVNREVVRPGSTVKPGDEVAFLPPVAGG